MNRCHVDYDKFPWWLDWSPYSGFQVMTIRTWNGWLGSVSHHLSPSSPPHGIRLTFSLPPTEDLLINLESEWVRAGRHWSRPAALMAARWHQMTQLTRTWLFIGSHLSSLLNWNSHPGFSLPLKLWLPSRLLQDKRKPRQNIWEMAV